MNASIVRSLVCRPSVRGLRFPARSGVAAALLLLAATAARANDPPFFFHNARLDLLGNVTMWVYSPAVWLVEGAVLNGFFRFGYWKCVGLAAVANVASTIVSMIWYFSQSGGWAEQPRGWKTAWIYGNLDQFALLLIRSFLVTASVEAVIIILILGKRMDSRRTIAAVACANAVSYALSAALIPVIGHFT
ncbi:MAG TPA: hypothetical protein VGM37_21425 [Armatimonadota bacterium]|jgi:hypothetical protein